MDDAGTVEVNGTKLYFEAEGAGPVLLFLHGFTLDRRIWRRQVEALSREHRVVTYDARGFGRSAMPGKEPYRHDEDAAALIERLGLGRVIAVGHSIGAHQMLELTLARPDLVCGFASVCGSGLAGIPFPEDVMQLFAAVRQAAGQEGVVRAKQIWSRSGWFASAREQPALAAELDRILGDYSAWHWQNDNPSRTLEPSAASRLGELRIPALVINGARDLPYNHAVASALVQGIAGAAELQLPNAGHMANMEAPDDVNAAIAALAARVAPS